MAKYYIIAGEASGDLHGSKLIEGLLAKDPSAVIRFWGGEKMATAYEGGLVVDYRKTAVMGFKEVIKKSGEIFRRLRFCKKDILSFAPDVVIFIDYPGFNLRIAEWAHKNGFKTVYYIAPKVWASREGRAKKLRKYIDRLIIIFPFEVPYFESKGIKADYVGCPLVDIVNETIRHSNAEEHRTIALLAGSRTHEIKSMMKPLQDFARGILKKYPDYRFVIAAAPNRTEKDYPIAEDLQDKISIAFSRTYEVIRSADLAIVNSGTASLETLILGTPQVVGYILDSNLLFSIGRHFLKVKYISLGNLCANKLIFKELLQKDCTGQNLLTEALRILEDPQYRAQMLSDYASVMAMLTGGKPITSLNTQADTKATSPANTQPAAHRAAEICLTLAKQSSAVINR